MLSQIVFTKMYLFKILKKAKVCLPKLEIEKFDEDVINWSSFWDQFSSAAHENDSEINKFTYLKSFLCDSAKLIISGLSLLDFHQKIIKRLLIFSNSVLETPKF